MKETGIEVLISDTPDFAKGKAQVESGNVEWDVFDAIGSHASSGALEGIWEPLDQSIVETPNLSVPATKTVVGFYVWAGGISWDPSRTPKGKNPSNFKELWDLENFPGRRAFRARPYETLEMALVADGVAPKDLYPLDVDRAFDALERIKSSVSNWVKSTPQTIELLRNNETDFSYTYTGRVAAAQTEGISIDIALDQTVNGMEYLTVLKGTKKGDAAMKFIAFCLRPDRQAAFSELHYVNPNRSDAVAQISQDAKKWLPDVSNPKNIILDDFWWGDHNAKVSERFNEWMLI
jgi:putative spermidine/putrescine transport system substrate-binding protein